MDFLKLSADKVLKIHLLEKEILTGSTLKNHRREIDTFVNILTKTLTNVRVTSLISNGASENFGMIAKSIRLIFVGFDDETNYPDCYLQYTALDDSIHFSAEAKILKSLASFSSVGCIAVTFKSSAGLIM